MTKNISCRVSAPTHEKLTGLARAFDLSIARLLTVMADHFIKRENWHVFSTFFENEALDRLDQNRQKQLDDFAVLYFRLSEDERTTIQKQFPQFMFYGLALKRGREIAPTKE